MVSVYAISDLHANHPMIREYEPDRPEKFEQAVLNQLRQLPARSILVNNGDLVFKDHRTLMDAYRRATRHLTSVLVKGNHDNKGYYYYYDYFDFVCEQFTMYINGQIHYFTHKPMEAIPGGCLNIHGHIHGDNHREEYHLTSSHHCVTWNLVKIC